jgi:hypothetical protein
MVIFILNIRRSARIATDYPDSEKELRYHILCAAFKIMDNSSIIDAPPSRQGAWLRSASTNP